MFPTEAVSLFLLECKKTALDVSPYMAHNWILLKGLNYFWWAF